MKGDVVSNHDDTTELDAIIDRVRAAAVQWHLGHYLDLDQMQAQAQSAGDAAIQDLEHLCANRDALITLLSDQDDGVRAIAASYLLPTRPELALPVLHDLNDNCITEASFTALGVLLQYENRQRSAKSSDV